MWSIFKKFGLKEGLKRIKKDRKYIFGKAQGGRIGAQDVDPMAEIVALMSKRMTEGLTPDETDRLYKIIQAT